MIDISKTDKELSDHAKYAIAWLESHGFSGRLLRNNTKMVEFEVEKDGTSDRFRLTATQQSPTKCDIKMYMVQFEKSFALKQEIERLRKELKK